MQDATNSERFKSGIVSSCASAFKVVAYIIHKTDNFEEYGNDEGRTTVCITGAGWRGLGSTLVLQEKNFSEKVLVWLFWAALRSEFWCSGNETKQGAVIWNISLLKYCNKYVDREISDRISFSMQCCIQSTQSWWLSDLVQRNNFKHKLLKKIYNQIFLVYSHNI